MKADHVQHKLADHIEKFVLTIVEEFGELRYRDINIQYAIERELYVKCANNQKFLDAFYHQVILGLDGAYNFSDPILNILVSSNEGGDHDKKYSLRIKFIFQYLFNVMGVIYFSFVSIFYNLKHKIHTNHNSSIYNKIIFVSIEKKHTKYIEPIAQNIGADSSAFLFLRNYAIDNTKENRFAVLIPLFYPYLKGRIKVNFSHPLYMHIRKASFYVDAYIKFVSSIKPKSLVFTEGSSYEEDILSRIAFKYDVPTVRVQYGRAGILYNGYRNLIYDKMLMWGEGFIERLKQVSPSPSYIVTGSHVLDSNFALDSNDLSKIENISKGKELITIVTQPICATIDDEDYALLVRCVEFILQNKNDYLVLVRKHPADNCNMLSDLQKVYSDNIVITQADDLNIMSVIRSSKYLIGFYSTMLSEAVAVGVLPIILPLKNSNQIFPAPEEEGAAIKIQSKDQLESVLDYVLSNSVYTDYKAAMENFRNKYFYKMDGKSVERVCNEINRISSVV